MGDELDLFGASYIRREAEWMGDHRITLRRWWDAAAPRALVIGCNPSTADANREDPTTHWLNAWFRLFGFGGYDLGNLYPCCSPSPAEAREWADWENNGPDWYARDAIHANLHHVVRLAKAASQVFVCWGAIAWDQDWIDHVVEEIQTGPAPWPDLYCWGETKNGAPKHPMARGVHRIPRDQPPILWSASHVHRVGGSPSPVLAPTHPGVPQ